MSLRENTRSELQNILGRNIAYCRKRAGLPLKRVAHELGVSITTCSQWENGFRFPTAEHFMQLSKLLKCPPSCLFCKELGAEPSNCPKNSEPSS